MFQTISWGVYHVYIGQWVLVEPLYKRHALEMRPFNVIIVKYYEDVLQTAVKNFFIANEGELFQVWVTLHDLLKSELLYSSKLLIILY
jgi:hypothetical protein